MEVTGTGIVKAGRVLKHMLKKKKTKVALKGLLVGIRVLMVILARTRVETRNMLLETGRKAVLVRKWKKTWLNCVLVLCGMHNFWVTTLDV